MKSLRKHELAALGTLSNYYNARRKSRQHPKNESLRETVRRKRGIALLTLKLLKQAEIDAGVKL